MGKLLTLASLCCCILAVTNEMRAEQQKDKIKSEEVEELKDFYIRKLYSRLLKRRGIYVDMKDSVMVEPVVAESENVASAVEPLPVMPEVVLLHNQLQNKLGWGGDDNGGGGNGNSMYGPPGGFGQNAPSQNYGPPPNQQYGPPPGPPNQQYGPPPNQQYGPPPQQNQPNQQYGPPPGPPSQQYGPPPQQSPPNQQYGPPPAPPSQNYGPPPSQNYGPPPQQSPPNQQYGPPPGPPSQNYGPPPQQSPPNQQYGPPPSQNYGPPPQQSSPNQQYGAPPSQQYGPPQQSQPNQEYGPPPSQSYGAPQQSNNNIRVNQGTFGGHIENFKLSEALGHNNNKGNNNGNRNNLKSITNSLSSQYGPPSSSQETFNDVFTNSNGNDRNPKIFKHVYIHTPPADDDIKPQTRVIRPNSKQDTHYQIIFVKAPAPPKVQTEIEIPPAPERKTLVYVLVKRPEKSEIKFRPAPPTQPPKPEVYFIRYKGDRGNQNSSPSLPIDNDNQNYPGDQVSFNGNDLGNNDNGYSNNNNNDNLPYNELFNDNMSDLIRNALSSGRDSVSYPNTEYRAPPNMLGPNAEPMSIAVYDKVRNSVNPTANPRRSDILASSSSLSPKRKSRKYTGSHYTAPGSLPFEKASGKMVNGHYIGMSSASLRKQYYAPEEDDEYEGMQPLK